MNCRFEGTLKLSEFIKRGMATNEYVVLNETEELITLEDAKRIAGVSGSWMDLFTTWTHKEGSICMRAYLDRWKKPEGEKEAEEEVGEDSWNQKIYTILIRRVHDRGVYC